MSGECLGKVLRSGPRPGDLDRDRQPYTTARARALRAVLITIADVANRDGQHAHPGIEAMCEGSLFGRRQAQRIVADLVAEGWVSIEDVGGGRGRATVFTVHTDKVPDGRDQNVTLCETAPFSEDEGCPPSGDPSEGAAGPDGNSDIFEDDPLTDTAPFCDLKGDILEETAPLHPDLPGTEQPPTVYTTSDTTKEPPNPPKSGGDQTAFEADVRRVFDAWRDALGKPHAQLDRARRRPIEQAIRSHGLDDAIDAVRGIRLDEWAVKVGRTEPRDALGNAGLIEKYRDLHRDHLDNRPQPSSKRDHRDGTQLGASFRLAGDSLDELEDLIDGMPVDYQQAARDAYRKDSAA